MYIYNLVSQTQFRVDVLSSPIPGGGEEHALSPTVRVLRRGFLYRGADKTRFRLFRMFAGVVTFMLASGWRGRHAGAVLNMEIAWNSLLILLSRLTRVPAIGVAYAEEITMALYGSTRKHRFKRWLLRHVYTRADGFVTVCGFTRDLLVDLGMPRDRIVVIPPAVTERKNTTNGLQVRSSSPRRTVLSVGRLVDRKGFHFLVQAIGLLRDESVDIYLAIAGEGPMRPHLEAQIARLGLAKHVTLLGGVADDDLATLYAECDVFVLANFMMENGNCEGAPTVLLEAAACGKPVIAGRAGGTADVVEEGVTGLLIDPTNPRELAAAIRRVVDDPGFAARLGRAGQDKVRQSHQPVHMRDAFEAFITARLSVRPSTR